MSYGMQLFNSSGTVILDVGSRLPRYVASGVTASLATGSSVVVNITDLDTSDSWIVFSIKNSGASTGSTLNWRTIKSTGYFTIYNDTGTTDTFYWWVFKS